MTKVYKLKNQNDLYFVYTVTETDSSVKICTLDEVLYILSTKEGVNND